MTIVRRPSPFGELMSLRSAMDRLFEDSFVRRPFGSSFEGMASLPVDVTRTADELIVEAALPGIHPDDVDITVEDGALSIRGEFREERSDAGAESDKLVTEIRRRVVGRTLSLPTGLEPDKATATFEHGVLTLRIPKAESVKPRQIRISAAAKGSTETRKIESPSGNGRSKTPAGVGPDERA